MTIGPVLGIDPSDTEHAWALIDGKTILGFGQDFGSVTRREREMADIIAIEMIASYGMPVGAHTFDTCVEIGILKHQLHLDGRNPRFITRVEVKRIVCRAVNAKDSNVRAAVIDYFGGPKATKKGGQLHSAANDVWAALAVAIAASSGEARWYITGAQQDILK